MIRNIASSFAGTKAGFARAGGSWEQDQHQVGRIVLSETPAPGLLDQRLFSVVAIRQQGIMLKSARCQFRTAASGEVAPVRIPSHYY